MPVSSDLVQISIAREASYGGAVDGDWYLLPIVSEGVAPNVETTLSNLITPNRQVADSILTGITAEGNIETEMVICDAFQVILESAMSNDINLELDGVTPIDPAPVINEDPADLAKIKVGLIQKSFKIEKRFPDPLGTPGTDYLYQTIHGAVVNTFSVATSTGEAVTWSAGILGKELVPANAGVATPAPLGNISVLRSTGTIDLQFQFPSLATEDLDTRCFGDFGFNINNNYRSIQCIGPIDKRHIAMGRCEVDISAMVHLRDNALLESVLSQEDVIMEYRVQNANDPITTFGGMFSGYFPRCKFTADSVVAGGTGTDVVNDATLSALYDTTEMSTLTLGFGSGLAQTT